jgi:two-component system nitrogen regulation sensor histidine kinase GlnL
MKDLQDNSSRAVAWEQVLTSLEDGVVTTDARGKITFFNEAAEILTELSAARAVKQPFTRLFVRDPWLIDLVKKSFPPRQESVRGEGELLTPRMRRNPVSISVSPLLDHSGGFSGSVIILRDVKRRREIEEDLKRADRLALMGTLAAGLAHEIRNPLGGIRGAAQLLQRSFDRDSPLLEYTGIMIREVDRVNHLIEQLLDLSKPVRLKLAPVNIHEILEEVLWLECQNMPGQDYHVKKLFDPSLPPIRGDKARLTQVFLNLIKNAFQAMDGRGTVTITTRMETDFHIRDQTAGRSNLIWVDIQDQGSGIKEQDLPHIFSPFFTTKNNGSGLGLPVCYRIIREHGGLIRVESSEGKGTTFHVSLIVADSD